MKDKSFYLWLHPYNSKTCYGITTRLDLRRKKYEAHAGFDIAFSYVVTDKSHKIDELEQRLKDIVAKTKNNWKSYEWINGDIGYNSVIELVEFHRKDLLIQDPIINRNIIEE